MRIGILSITILFVSALIFTSLVRAGLAPGDVQAIFEGRARWLYILSAVLAGVLLARAGAPIDRWGFERGPTARHMLLALVGVAVIQGFEHFMLPSLTGVVAAGPASSEFDGLAGDLPRFLILLGLSWTVAAIGEEIAFRVIMMRGVAASFGGGATASIVALILQAAVFGFVHFYNGGQLAVVRTAFNGVIYGALVLASRGVVWPAVFAHGLHNTIGLSQDYWSGD